MPNGSGLLDSHEDRLQKVESSVQEAVVKITEIGLKQDYHHEIEEKYRKDLSDRLDSWSTEVRAGLARTQDHLQAAVDLNQKQEARLEPLEAHVREQHLSRKARKELLKKLMLGALLAGAGVVGTKGVEILFGLMVK